MWHKRKVLASIAVAFVIYTTAFHAVSYLPPTLSASFEYNWGLYGPAPTSSFASSKLHPPVVNFNSDVSTCVPGYTLIAPRGTMVREPGIVMLDSAGDLVWMDTSYGVATDIRVQTYQDKQYLTFWVGTQEKKTFGKGHYVMVDENYRVFRTVYAANGLPGDLHSFTITSDDTALITIYHPVAADLSSFEISAPGWIQDSIIQEVNITDNSLIFEWRASEHFTPAQSYVTPTILWTKANSPLTAFDFFHINSVQKTSDGNYIISSRYFKAIYCLDGRTGRVLWSLGGRDNTFLDLSDGRATDFEWQHHATLHESANETYMTIFDNHQADWFSAKPQHSRGLLISLDISSGNRSVTLKQEFLSPFAWGAQSQGSTQLIPDWNRLMVGWGSIPRYTEYDIKTGEVTCDVQFGPSIIDNLGWTTSYRAFHAGLDEWIGRPLTRPDIHAEQGAEKIAVSWNGATEVSGWRIEGSDGVNYSNEASSGWQWVFLGQVGKEGFETEIELDLQLEMTDAFGLDNIIDTDIDLPPYLRIAAVDAAGKILAYTDIIQTAEGTVSRSLLMIILERIIIALAAIATVLVLAWRYRVERLRIRDGTQMQTSRWHWLLRASGVDHVRRWLIWILTGVLSRKSWRKGRRELRSRKGTKRSKDDEDDVGDDDAELQLRLLADCDDNDSNGSGSGSGSSNGYT